MKNLHSRLIYVISSSKIMCDEQRGIVSISENCILLLPIETEYTAHLEVDPVKWSVVVDKKRAS